jgi:hypothetical protein
MAKTPFSSGAVAGFFEQELQPALVDLLWVPPRLRKEPLQALRFLSLRSGHGFGISQGSKQLVAFGRKQEPLQVTPEAIALGASAKEIVGPGCLLFQRTGCRLYGSSSGHGGHGRHDPFRKDTTHDNRGGNPA